MTECRARPDTCRARPETTFRCPSDTSRTRLCHISPRNRIAGPLTVERAARRRGRRTPQRYDRAGRRSSTRVRRARTLGDRRGQIDRPGVPDAVAGRLQRG